VDQERQMRYFGSKQSTADAVYRLVADRRPGRTFCDPFGGIGIVGATFKRGGYQVWSGDLLQFAHLFQVARIEMHRPPRFCKVRRHLNIMDDASIEAVVNSAPSGSGWLVSAYSGLRQA
jgi:adenine-specific DNA-methyltransferase